MMKKLKKIAQLFKKKIYPVKSGPVFKTIFGSLTSGTKVKDKINNRG